MSEITSHPLIMHSLQITHHNTAAQQHCSEHTAALLCTDHRLVTANTITYATCTKNNYVCVNNTVDVTLNTR